MTQDVIIEEPVSSIMLPTTRVGRLGVKILLVEDKESLRQMLVTALKKVGYSVDEAPDGNTAVQKIRKQPYNLVLSDLRLPNLSGLDILKTKK